MAQVDVPGRNRLRASVPFRDDLFVQDAHFTHEKEAHILHQIIRQLLIGYIITDDVEAEALPLYAAAVGKVSLEIEFHPFIHKSLLATLPDPVKRNAALQTGFRLYEVLFNTFRALNVTHLLGSFFIPKSIQV